MKTLILVAGLATGACGLAASVPSVPADVLYLPHARVEASYAHAGGPWVTEPSFKVMTSQRVAPGVVEMHTFDTDVFYIVQGRAQFVTGGTGTQMTETKPGEWRGKTIEGGTTHTLEAGDVIVIPNGVPHQYTAIDGTFRYFVVKITQK